MWIMRNTKVIRTSSALCWMLICTVLVGCGLGRQSVALDFRNPLSEQMSTLKDSGGTAPLNTLTDFGWDQVYLFHEAASRDDIEKLVGEPVIKDKYFGSSVSLLVFKQDGGVVRAIGLTADYLRASGAGPFGPDVVVGPWGNGAMRLTEPGANPAPQ